VHNSVLIVLVLAALSLRTYFWRTRMPGRGGSVGTHLVTQFVLVAVVVIVNWLSFQTGMAMHEPPDSLNEFLWSDP
jgi:hypothetical protein